MRSLVTASQFPVQTIKKLLVALGRSKVSCSSAYSASIHGRIISGRGRVHHRGYAGLRGAWRDRDPNDIFAHCCLIFLLTSNFPTLFVLLNLIHPLIWFFFKNSFSKKKNIRKTTQYALAPSIFIVLAIVLKLGTTAFTYPQRKIRCYGIFNFALEVEIRTKNLQKRCFTLPGKLWWSVTFFAGRN